MVVLVGVVVWWVCGGFGGCGGVVGVWLSTGA